MIAKKQNEIENLRTAGKILSDVLKEVAGQVHVGTTTASLDLLAEQLIRRAGAVPAFLNYKPAGAAYPYPAVLCVSINDEVVHGIPSEDDSLKDGDIVMLDLGLSYNGFFADSARMVCVGGIDAKTERLFAAVREALAAGVAAARVGNRIGDIGAAIEAVARKYGYAIAEDLGGHALGTTPHEKPFIANFGTPGTGEKIVEGMVLAIEPIFIEGKSGAIVLDDDEWTYRTRSGARSAEFEQTILVTKDTPEILTPF